MSLRKSITKFTGNYSEQIEKLREEIERADAILIGAGAGLSASAGMTYSGERFERYFADFHKKYGITDMYSGGFYPYETLEEYWAYWSRYIYINRYMAAPTSVYQKLLKLIQTKDYFVLTTNVDHQFQIAGFEKDRLFYTQGDYGLFQCSQPCHKETYDNKKFVCKMIEVQGYQMTEDGKIYLPEGITAKQKVSNEWIPYCPKCGKPMSMNLRADETFVEDEGWHRAERRYRKFLYEHQNMKILFWELGVGYNTPSIIKFSFWQMMQEWKDATYACINYGEAWCPEEIRKRSICVDGDIGETLKQIILQ